MSNKNKPGRPEVPPERKKIKYYVYLNESDKTALETRFGTLTLALRSHLINEPTEKQALETLKQVQGIIKKVLE